MDEIKNEIIAELKGTVPNEIVLSIEKLLEVKKYRIAFLKLDEIKKSSKWKVSQRYLSLLEQFWWTYAN